MFGLAKRVAVRLPRRWFDPYGVLVKVYLAASLKEVTGRTMGKIIWLASYPKSGNTWIRVFLHNLLRNADESYDINKIGAFSLGDSTPDLYAPYLQKPPEQWTVEDITRLRSQVQRDLSARSPDDVFVKTHNALIQYAGKPLIYPEFTAGAIYVLRNPLDVCISLAHHYASSIDWAIEMMNNPNLGTGTNHITVHQVYRSWSMHVASWTRGSGPRMLVLRYEDMLNQPVQTFGKIARFLGVTPDPARLQRAIENASFEQLRAQEDRAGFIEQPNKDARFFRAGKAGQWRDVLDQRQIDSIVAAHREQMLRFGYLPLK